MELAYDVPEYVVGGDEDVLHFEVRAEVSEGLDEDASNGWMSTTFQRPPTWQYNDLDDNRMIVWTRTNNAPGETTVELTRADGSCLGTELHRAQHHLPRHHCPEPRLLPIHGARQRRRWD